MKELFPPLEHYTAYDLSVDPIHTIHVREYGNHEGKPVVFLHGGPGSGCQPDHARFFNPEKYRIILFDQRGCGRSTPCGELTDNSTWHLVEDMEKIREHLSITQWLLFAGSWGATLALVYAEAYPDKVSGMILRGTYLARQKDMDWFFTELGVARIFPQAWQDFTSWLPESDYSNLIRAYYECLTNDDKEARDRAVRLWSNWGDVVVTNGSGNSSGESNESISAAMLAKVQIEAHYAQHRYFLEENQLLNHAAKLPEAPIIITHGLHDLVCLPEAAFALHKAVSGSELNMVDSGHLASELSMVDVLVNTTEYLVNEELKL